MIARGVLRTAEEVPGFVACDSPECAWSYAQLRAMALHLAKDLESCGGQRVGLYRLPPHYLIAGIAACEFVGAQACLLPTTVNMTQVTNELALVQSITSDDFPHGCDVVGAALDIATEVESRLPLDSEPLVLYTSGTSGPPRPVIHHWAQLVGAIRHDACYRRQRWLTVYDPASYAGLQVVLQSLLTEGTLVHVPVGDVAAASKAIVESNVSFASATPTFWRMLLNLLSQEDAEASALRQITLGGEPVDQATLDALAKRFPKARLTHIYASTEMGVCFSVHDGKAGFPYDYLEPGRLAVGLRISDEGELLIHSPRGMAGLVDREFNRQEWFPTGDLVRVAGDRVHFLGRKSGTINVGGHKVLPEEIEAIVRQVPGVCEVRIAGIPSSVVGELVSASVVLSDGIVPADAEAAIQDHCQDVLPRYMIPAMIQFVDALPVGRSGKLARCRGEE